MEIPKPSVYDGRITEDAVENWILEIQRWWKNQVAWRWRGHHILEENKISLTGQYTSVVALQWWTEHEKRLLEGDPLSKYTTLDEFLLGMIASFTPKNIQEERWRKFDNLKQVTSAQEFSHKLTAQRRLLEPFPTDYDVAQKFHKGLKDRVRFELGKLGETPQKLPLERLIERADQIDSAIQDQFKRLKYLQGQKRNDHLNSLEELELNTLALQLNVVQSKSPKSSSKGSSKSSNSSKSDKKGFKCLNCDALGHPWYKCSKTLKEPLAKRKKEWEAEHSKN